MLTYGRLDDIIIIAVWRYVNNEENCADEKKCLTSIERPDKLLKHCFGEVSEWFKELVLKTSDSERGRGFESHLLRYAEAGYRVLQRFIIMKVSLL